MVEMTQKRGRGRKPVPDDKKRKHAVTCRLTDEEQAHVEALRGAISAGEWIRRAALSAPPRIVPQLNREAWAELSRAAANLNQIAKAVNIDLEELVNVQEHLKAFRLALIGADQDEG
jgi:hypothetical protein